MIVDFSEAVGAYQQVRANFTFEAVRAIALVIGFFIAGNEILKTFFDRMRSSDVFETKALLEPLIPLFKFAFVAFFTPYLIVMVESSFGYIETSLSDQTSVEQVISTDAVVNGYVKKLDEAYEASYMWEKPGIYIKTLLVKALGWCIAFLDNYLFSLYLVGRYLYLLLLEIVAPIAIMLSMHKDTRFIFYGWLKNMLMCYLLVPAFLVAVALSNAIGEQWSNSLMHNLYGSFNGEIAFGMLVVQIFLGRYLLKQSKDLIFKTLG